MSDKPILFNAEMVRAILEGRKTQTRRQMKPQPYGVGRNEWRWDRVGGNGKDWWSTTGGPFDMNVAKFCEMFCPHRPGDRLWVRETWFADPPNDGSWAYTQWSGCSNSKLSDIPECHQSPGSCIFRATWAGQDDALRWRPSIHMPRWASRITLPLVSVRVERLQDISCADAMAEGISATANQFSIDCDTEDPRRMFVALWTSIHGPESRDANPWVWVLEWSKAEVRP